MKKLIFPVLAAVLLIFACDNGGVEKETNPFVGTWELPPDGINQIVFFSDGRAEFRSFSWDSTANKYKLLTNYFGTYTHEGKQAIIDWDYNRPNTVVFDMDKVLLIKTGNPTIKEWI